MEPTAKHCTELHSVKIPTEYDRFVLSQPTTHTVKDRGRGVKRSSLRHSNDDELFRVLNRKPCPLSAFYHDHQNTTHHSATRRSRRSFLDSNKVREEEAHARLQLQQMQRHLDRASVVATDEIHTKDLDKEQRMLELVSRLEQNNKKRDRKSTL